MDLGVRRGNETDMEVSDVVGGVLDDLELALASSIRAVLRGFYDRNGVTVREMEVAIGQDHCVVVDCVVEYGDLEIRRVKGET